MNQSIKVSLVLFICISPWLLSAQNYKRTAKKMFDKQQYMHAAANYLEALMAEKKPEKKFKWKCEMQEALIQAEPSTLGRIARLQDSIKAFKGDLTVAYASSIVSSYDSLTQLDRRFQSLSEAARQTKKCNALSFSTGDYSEDRKQAAQRYDTLRYLAADFHYQNAQELMVKDKMYHYRTAYLELQYALNFVANYKNAIELQAKALKGGQRRILLTPFVYRGAASYQSQGQILINAVIGKIENDKAADLWITIVDHHYVNRSKLEEGTINETARELGVDNIYVGQITSISFPADKEEYKDGSGTQKVKIGERKVAIPEDPGKYKTEILYGEETYTYREYTHSIYADLVGNYRVYYSGSGEWGNTKQVKEGYFDSYTWSVKTGGSEKAWKKSATNKTRYTSSSLASPSKRVSAMIESASKRIAAEIIKADKHNPIPLKTTLEDRK